MLNIDHNMQDTSSGAGSPEYLLFNRRSCEDTFYSKARTDLDIFNMQHRSIHSDPGVHFDKQRFETLLIKNHLLKQLEDANRVVLRHDDRPRYRIRPSAGFNDASSGQAVILQSMCKKYSTKPCLLRADRPNGLSRHSNSNKINLLPLDCLFLDQKCSNQSRVVSTSLSSSATSLYSEEEIRSRYSRNPSPAPSMTSECPSMPSQSCRSSIYEAENDQEWEEILKDLTLTKEQQNIENNNVAANDNSSETNLTSLDVNLTKNFDQMKLASETNKNVSVSSSVLSTVLEEISSIENSDYQSRDALTDNDEEEELEQYALSDFWRFEEDHRRWSRLDSKASSIGSPTIRSANSVQKQSVEGLNEESNGEVFSKDDTLRAIHNENSGSEEKLNRTSIDQPRLVPNKPATLKPKSHSFLKRVGGDLKKFGSFRRKEQQRPTVVEIPLDDSWSRPTTKTRHKSLRKTRNVTISKPVLQAGHEKLESMKCTSIDASPTGVKELQDQHRGRKPSSHSLMSSSSSGGASTISTPTSRRTRASTEDFSSDIGEISPGSNNRNRIVELNLALRMKDHTQDNSTFVMPRDYKPGTFPAALRERTDDEQTVPSTVSKRSHSVSESMQSASENPRKESRPMSIYDNLPETAIKGNVSAQDIIKILDPGSPLIPGADSDVYMGSMESLEVGGSVVDPAFWSVDDIVEHTQNLQQMVGAWGFEDYDEDEDRINAVDSTLDPPFPASEVLPSYNADNVSNNDDESDTTSQTSSEQRNQTLLRWEPLKRENSNSSTTSDNLQLHTLSACQLMMLRRLSMLKLTARMEQYALNSSKGTLSWSVPRFIRRIKVPDYKDKTVFGVPLLQNVQRFGQPLPICIQHALAYLRRTALDQVGLFRKPGVKGRIHKLRELCEVNPDLEVFEDCSAYDIADLIKQYFRSLPDPLMTMKMSETFIGIFLYVPENLWLQTLQTAILLLPDENRETLKTLLHFLADLASNYSENHMNAINLSTCFAPSLFYQQLGNARLMAATVSPKVKKAQGGRVLGLQGKPDMKAMSENKASNQCLAFMIMNINELFKISEDATTQCRMSVMQQTEDVLATEIGYKSDHQNEKDYYADFHAYVDRVIRHTMREEQRFNQNRGWQSVPTSTGCELAYKKMNDGNPLRMWRGQVEVTGADANQIMDRILNERHLWDPELLQWKVLQQPDEKSQLFQVVRTEMSPQPSRDYCVLRSWRNDVTPRGTAAIVEVSTGPHPLLGDVRGVILTSRYVIDPTDVPNKCILTHMCRVDTKGRNPEWYNKAYGHIVSQNLLRIKDSIKNLPPKMTSLIA